MQVSDFQIQMHRDMIPTHALNLYMVPDPEWSYKDKKGHKHCYTKIGKHYKCKTVDWVLVSREWDEELHDYYENWAHICKQCGEEIKLGMKSGKYKGSDYIPGRATFTGSFLTNKEPGTCIDLDRYTDKVSGRAHVTSVEGLPTGAYRVGFVADKLKMK